MLKASLFISLLSCTCLHAALEIESSAFKNESCLPDRFTYCRAGGRHHIEPAADVSPPLMWKGAPKGTKSFALLVTDPDAINSPKYNTEGTTFNATSKRSTIFHWVLVNIPKNIHQLPEGAGSKGFIEGGKKTGETDYGLTGENVYTEAFRSRIGATIEFPYQNPEKMKGTYGGYDGGCPPWNDDEAHGYTFTIYALDVDKLDLPESGDFSGEDALKAMKGHILDQASLVGNYSTNPDVITKTCKKNK